MWELLSLRDIFGDVFSGARLVIPSYKKEFSWENRQIENLWSDIKKIAKKQSAKPHFLGTILAKSNKIGSKNAASFDVLDGQNRLVAIFIFLAIFISKSKNKEALKAKYLLDKNKNFKLKIQSQSGDFFEKMLREILDGTLSAKSKKEGTNAHYAWRDGDIVGYPLALQRAALYLAIKYILNTTKQVRDADKYIRILLDTKIIWWAESSLVSANLALKKQEQMPATSFEKLRAFLCKCASHCKCQDSKKEAMISSIDSTFARLNIITPQIENYPYGYQLYRHISQEALLVSHLGSKLFNDTYINAFDGFLEAEDSRRIYEKIELEISGILHDWDAEKNYAQIEKFLCDYPSDLLRFCATFLELLKAAHPYETLLDSAHKNINFIRLFMSAKVNFCFYNSIIRLKMDGELDSEIIGLIIKADILLTKCGRDYRRVANYAIGVYFSGGKKAFREYLINECKRHKLPKTAMKHLVFSAYNLGSYGAAELFCFLFIEHNFSNTKKLKAKLHLVCYLGAMQIIKDNAPKNRLKALGFESKDALDSLVDSYGNLLLLDEHLAKHMDNPKRIYNGEIYQKSIFALAKKVYKNFNKNKILERNLEFQNWLKNEFFKDFF